MAVRRICPRAREDSSAVTNQTPFVDKPGFKDEKTPGHKLIIYNPFPGQSSTYRAFLIRCTDL
jgi:hypothetical protein